MKTSLQPFPRTDSSPTDSDQTILALDLAQAARRMNSHPDLPSTISSVLTEARRLIVVDGIGLQISTKGVLRTVAATESSIWQISEDSDHLHDGPEHAPLWTENACRIINVSSDHHWPRWAAQVRKLGWRSLLSVRLIACPPPPAAPRVPRTIGALILYSRTIRGWTAEHDLAQAFAAHAESAIAHASERATMTLALEELSPAKTRSARHPGGPST